MRPVEFRSTSNKFHLNFKRMFLFIKRVFSIINLYYNMYLLSYFLKNVKRKRKRKEKKKITVIYTPLEKLKKI